MGNSIQFKYTVFKKELGIVYYMAYGTYLLAKDLENLGLAWVTQQAPVLKKVEMGVVVHIYNPTAEEMEAGGIGGSRSALAMQQV